MANYESTELFSLVQIEDVIKDYLPIQKIGENYRSKCPFHHDSDPSLVISPKLGIFKCFGSGCGETGNAASFISKYDDIPYPQALAQLAEKVGRPDLAPKARGKQFNSVYEMNDFALSLYQNILFTKDDLSSNARMALRDRRITQETAKLFQLGYSPNSWTWLVDKGLDNELLEKSNLILKTDAGHYRDYFKNRIIFPIFHQKKLIGFTGRTLGVSQKIPKYLNSKDSDWFKKSKILYGWAQNAQQIRRQKEIVITEGQFDVLQLHQRGIQNAVAVSGSYFGPDQANLFQKAVNKAVIMSDGDKAGVEAVIRIGEFLIERNIDCHIVHVEGKDPDDLARYKHRFNWEKLNTKYGYNFVEFCHEQKGLESTLKRISGHRNKLKLSQDLKVLSDLSGYDEKHLEHWLAQYKKAPLMETIDINKDQLKLEDELMLLYAVNGVDVPVNGFLKKRLDKELVDNITNKPDGLAQDLARNQKFASRLTILDTIKDKTQYAKDLIIKLNLKYMKKEVNQNKQKYKETNDAKYLEKVESLVKNINKMKLKVRNGQSYSSSI
mgnify:FL=1